MAESQIEKMWSTVASRLEDDPKFARVIKSLEPALSSSSDDEKRPRLKVPYANTASFVGGEWQ